MSIVADRSGPPTEERQLVYARMQLSAQHIRHIENMIAGSGVRRVAKAALTNVRVRYCSPKNGESRVLESHTCELVHAYELELDPDVIGFYAQVPCHRVERVTQHGRRHISTATLDFLVFRRHSVELVECKQKAWLEAELCSSHTLWKRDGETWIYPPVAEWAARYRLAYRVWVSPYPVGVYRQNLEACCAVLGNRLDRREEEAVERAVTKIQRRPMTLEALSDEVPLFSPRLALWMLAHRTAFGPWKSTSVSLGGHFRLYPSEAQAQEVDAALMQSIVDANAQPSVTDALLLASATDLDKARQRLARLELIEAGHIPPTRRMRQLARHVRKAIAAGQSPLSACLTNYAKSGNRVSRLLPEQEHAIETVIAREWNTGKARRPLDLVYAFEKECERLGVEPSGRSRLDARRRSENPLRHALETGGFRAFHALRPSTDPRTRSLPPLGYGQVLHIDSSDLDVRCAPDLIRHFPAAKAKFYIGIDGATGDTMAHSLIFGPARTDGLALLIREYAKRHGFLPRTIHVDRGPENTSHWIDEFCDGRINLRHSPTAASAWNGIAENAIKQVNEQVAHKLTGSTAPDQWGRKVDGRFKSRNHARTAFTTVLERFIAFAYQDLPNTPRGDGRIPTEERDRCVEAYGALGVPCKWNDDFLIQTSIRIQKWQKPDAQRGVRTADGWFVSAELVEALRHDKAEEIRSDCCYPEVLYVRVGGRWIKAFHSRVQSIAVFSDTEKLFDLLNAPLRRSESRNRRDEIARARHSRQTLAEVARPAACHLAPQPKQKDEPAVEDARLTRRPDVDGLELTAFEEREDY